MTEPAETPPAAAPESACATCPSYRAARLKKLGLDMRTWDFAVALAGNPNTGKSTVFNSLGAPALSGRPSVGEADF